MATRVQEIIYSAMRLAGIITGPQRGMSASELADGMAALNSLIDEWGTDRLNIYTVSVAQYNLVVNQQVYTIGIDPDGVLIADFPVERPIEIQNANIITQISGSQPTRIPLILLNDDGWSQIAVQSTGSTIPQQLYDDYDYPLSKLYLWPYPTAAAQLELYTWQLLSQFTDASQTFKMPPGYRRAIEYNLAVDLANRFQNAQLGANVARIALETKIHIESKNAPEPVMSCDPAVLSTKKSTWNYLVGASSPGSGS